MRIAFDLDGVLADLHGPFVKTALRLFPEIDPNAVSSPEVAASPPEEDDDAGVPVAEGTPDRLVTDLALTPRQSDAVWRSLAATEDFWATLSELEPGIIARLAAVAEEHRWEVLFITSRPRVAGRTIQRQTQYWLEQRGFHLPSVYVVHGSRGRIAEALQLDIVVDDRPENCLDVVLESSAGAMLVWRGQRETVPASARRFGIAVVPTVAACLDALLKIEQPGESGGLLQRLRKLFGLQTTRTAAG
ncbi:MAG TPA: hypothetical protein VEK56_09345 [Vicinamibacterales bacterium]|nr:hypothetical protein [Vicinamibacterales bacterium]